MKFSLKNVLLSSFFGALGPFFNKQATLDQDRAVVKYLDATDYPWLIYLFNVSCIILMLWANTIAVKYKMLSYKFDGAFIGTTLIFVLGYIFSFGFDLLYSGQLPKVIKIVGACLIMMGIALLSWQENKEEVLKRAPSVLIVIEHHEDIYFDDRKSQISQPLIKNPPPKKVAQTKIKPVKQQPKAKPPMKAATAPKQRNGSKDTRKSNTP